MTILLPRYQLQIEIEPTLGCKVAPASIKTMLRAALSYEKVAAGASVWLRVTDDDELAELNQEHRGMAGPTDVLSFPTQSDQSWIHPPGAPVELGDIVISWPRVLAQAAEEGHGPEDELALLVVHGCLHLLGYDHLEPDDKCRMWVSQEAILAALGVHLKID